MIRDAHREKNFVICHLRGQKIAYWNNPRGSVCQNDVVALYAVLEKLGNQDTINLFIKSGGGTGQASKKRLAPTSKEKSHNIIGSTQE